MAFNKKVWKNRISENPLRRMITNITTGVSEIIDVTRYEGTITEAGDAFSAANMNDLENRIEQGINDAGSSDIIAGIEETDTASKAYTVNQYLIYDKKLYRVTSAIAVGNTLVPNVNIVEKKLADELSNHLVVNGNAFYFDVHDGEYGYNTSESRGADTFVPFKRSIADIATAYSWSGTSDWGQWSTTKTFSNVLSGVSKLIIPYVWYTGFTGASQQVGGVTIRADNAVLYTVSGLRNAGVLATNVYDVSGKNNLTFVFTSTYGGYFSVPNCYVI